MLKAPLQPLFLSFLQHQIQTATPDFSHPSPFSVKGASQSKFFSRANLFQHFLLIDANLTHEPKGSGPNLLQTPKPQGFRGIKSWQFPETPWLAHPCCRKSSWTILACQRPGAPNAASHSFSQANSVLWAYADTKLEQ